MGLLDPNWKYTHSTATDIRKTFEKVRRELTREERLQGPRRTAFTGSFSDACHRLRHERPSGL
jgi:hypothetical protein